MRYLDARRYPRRKWWVIKLCRAEQQHLQFLQPQNMFSAQALQRKTQNHNEACSSNQRLLKLPVGD